jgi:hypothetical protein
MAKLDEGKRMELLNSLPNDLRYSIKQIENAVYHGIRYAGNIKEDGEITQSQYDNFLILALDLVERLQNSHKKGKEI